MFKCFFASRKQKSNRSRVGQFIRLPWLNGIISVILILLDKYSDRNTNNLLVKNHLVPSSPLGAKKRYNYKGLYRNFSKKYTLGCILVGASVQNILNDVPSKLEQWTSFSHFTCYYGMLAL
jgi:hypothetical protein